MGGPGGGEGGEAGYYGLFGGKETGEERVEVRFGG